MSGAECGGKEEATGERGVEGSRRRGQRRKGRWKVRECGVEGKEGLLIGPGRVEVGGERDVAM